MATLPDWVRPNPEKFLKRLAFEDEMLSKAFPVFALMTEGDRLYAEGPFITHNGNCYRVRAWYPKNYPYEAPNVVVCDADVVEFCKNRGYHEFHHLGYDGELGGIKLCVLKPDGSSGQGWEPKFSVVTALNLAAAWLHAYEAKRAGGRWILPEA